MKKLLIIIMMSILSGQLFAQPDAGDIIKNVQKKYKKVNVLMADFRQINRYKIAEIESEVFGSIWITQDNKFRLATEDQFIVSDSENLWRYNKLENQVLIDYAQKSQQDIFLNNFLFQISDYYQSQLLNVNEEGKSTIYEMKLIPNDRENSFFEYIKVWLEKNSWLLKKVLYVDVNGNEVEYEIEKIELNPSVRQEVFTFEVPEGTEVVDLRF